MAAQVTKENLAALVRMALHSADAQAEWGAAAYLDQALIDLTGEGVMPAALAEPEHVDQRGAKS